ncbi:DUF3549 family protein [Oceanospirillum maris]|jgi:hypothetical protein|uniref:DUF3549 family protein n=1 Tax=Oceanospirillum maris TaxID=64977 RepID=UPI00040092F7|nr:DUF3549 family protein [Oceanospirillum maris]
MSDITTLTDFLDKTGAHLRVFDMGRRVSLVSANTFSRFEQCELPYPQPYMYRARLGLLFWYPQAPEQHFIWFLQFPLDEQGFIIQASRDEFLKRLLETIGQNAKDLSEQENEHAQNIMKDNPIAFTPDQERLAIFNAKAKLALGQPASRFHDQAEEYFTGQREFDDWEDVGLQGIADFTVRLEKQNNADDVTKHIAQFPDIPFGALCRCLENEVINHKLASAICDRANTLTTDPEADCLTLAAAIRGVSHSQAKGLRDNLVEAVLNSVHSEDIEILTVIAARAWETLENPALLKIYLEKLATCSAGEQAFINIVRDLIFVPGLRTLIIAQFRDPERSEALSNAIGVLMGEPS